MPPFDPFKGEPILAVLIRLANERDQSYRFTKKGDKRQWFDIEAQKASRRRTIKAKQEAATEISLARSRKRNLRRAAPGMSIAERMLRAMQPGQWYGVGDIARMVGEDRSSRGKVTQVLLRHGWVTASHNPAHSGQTLNPWEIMAGAEPEPKTLYSLTETGLVRREAAILAAGTAPASS